VSISALDEHIIDVGDPIAFDNMELLETISDSVSYMLSAGIENGTQFKYLISLDNGEFTVTDTITRVYGTEVVVFLDDCETTDNWISQKWNLTDEAFYSPENSMTDSPNQDYNDGENSSITLDTTISLANASIAFLKFRAKWNIEEAYDYVQVLVKEEGSATWTPLHGMYSSYGNEYLDPDEPVYDGEQNEWVQEEISLMDYANKEITLRFKFYSDQYVTEDGFYFDDLTISVISAITVINTPEVDKNPVFISEAYPNPGYDQFKVQYNLTENNQAVFELFNTVGNRQQSIKVYGLKGIIQVPVHELPEGIYYYRIVNGNQVSTAKKFIKL
jgi:hypothetical protein